MVDTRTRRYGSSGKRSRNHCNVWLILIYITRTNGDIFIFIDGKKVLEMAGTTFDSYTTTVSMNSLQFQFGLVYVLFFSNSI